MLKAVRFDEFKNKELIDYIDNYRDKNGKTNHSEAIRFLMEKGLENINNPTPIQKSEPIEIDKIKQEIMDELFKTIGKNSLQQPQIVYQQVEQPKTIIKEEVKEEIKKPQTKAPASVGGLMGNLLANANRNS